jgi:DNA-binding FadR family transcriptional regulator
MTSAPKHVPGPAGDASATPDRSRVGARSKAVAGHDELAAILACEIISGARPVGTRLPSVAEMFERFGASRVLMREVNKTLAAKGLIVGKSKVGTLVLPPERWHWFDPDFLLWRVRVGLDATFFGQLTQMRHAVEPAAAALAAVHGSAEQRHEIRAALAAMERARADRQAFVSADLRFHEAVGAASGNPLFRSFAGVVETALEASLSTTAPLASGAMAVTVARHAAIADAIEAGDPEAAASAMRAVIQEGADRLAEVGQDA